MGLDQSEHYYGEGNPVASQWKNERSGYIRNKYG